MDVSGKERGNMGKKDKDKEGRCEPQRRSDM